MACISIIISNIQRLIPQFGKATDMCMACSSYPSVITVKLIVGYMKLLTCFQLLITTVLCIMHIFRINLIKIAYDWLYCALVIENGKIKIIKITNALWVYSRVITDEYL